MLASKDSSMCNSRIFLHVLTTVLMIGLMWDLKAFIFIQLQYIHVRDIKLTKNVIMHAWLQNT